MRDRSLAMGHHPLRECRADSPPPCREGLGVGGTASFEVRDSPPPCPSPTGGEGTLRRAPRLISTARPSMLSVRDRSNFAHNGAHGLEPAEQAVGPADDHHQIEPKYDHGLVG